MEKIVIRGEEYKMVKRDGELVWIYGQTAPRHVTVHRPYSLADGCIVIDVSDVESESNFQGWIETANRRFCRQGAGIFGVYERNGNAFIFERHIRCDTSDVAALNSALEESRANEDFTR